MDIKKIPVSKGGKIRIKICPHGTSGTIETLKITDSTIFDILWPNENPGPEPINEPTLYTENDSTLNNSLNHFKDIIGNISLDHPQTYSYLHYAIKSVEDEWTNPNFLIQSNFEEIISWHGSISSKENSAHEGMKDWIIAMCLAEIKPIAAEAIYKHAYEIYNTNNNNDLYCSNGGFTIKGDINMCRLTAVALWAVNRSKYNDSTISKMRNEIGGSTIDGVWNDKSGNVIIGKINYDNIFPSAAGPYIIDANKFPSLAVQGERRPPSSQSNELFYNNEETMTKDYTNEFVYSPQTKNWTKYNYKIDVAIDDKITEDYNLDNPTYYKRTAQACADAEEDIGYYFSNRVYYKRSQKHHDEISEHYAPDNVSGEQNVRFTVYDKGNEVIFEKTNSSSNSDGYLEGPFNKDIIGKDLSDCAYDGSKERNSTHQRNGININGKTDLSYFLDEVGDLGSQSRKTLLNAQYGRRRPGQGQYNHNLEGNNVNSQYSEIKHYRGGGNRYHPLGFIRNFSVESIIGGVATNYDNNGNAIRYYIDDYEPWDQRNENEETFTIATDLQGGAAHTYPSGHSARMFAIAISLIRLFPKKAVNIFKAAYSFTVSRNIVRAHWNSDIIYGRLIGAMTIPFAHANQQFLSEYSYAAAYLGYSVPTPDPIKDNIYINLTIINNLNQDIVTTGQVNLYFNGHESVSVAFFTEKTGDGNNCEWNDHNSATTKFILPKGTKTFSNLKLLKGKNDSNAPSPTKYLNMSIDTVNNAVIYSWGYFWGTDKNGNPYKQSAHISESIKCSASTGTVLKNNATFTITIQSYDRPPQTTDELV